MTTRCNIGMWRSLVSALRSGRRGRAFESPHPDQPEARGSTPRLFSRRFRADLVATRDAGVGRPEELRAVV
jgi:hypothetical protein